MAFRPPLLILSMDRGHDIEDRICRNFSRRR